MEYFSEALQTPVLAQCDVAVAGGGIAGIAAALSAARLGADVVLVEREYLLGGLATLGLIAIYLPLCDGCGRQVSRGICDELFWLSIRHGPAGRVPDAWLSPHSAASRSKQRMKVQYDPQLFALSAENLLREAGVRILYGSAVCAARCRDGAVAELILENSAGRTALQADAVVDATGDATICHLAGEQMARCTQKNRLTAWYYSLLGGQNRLHILGESDEHAALHEPAAAQLGGEIFDGLDPWQLSAALGRAHEVQRRAFLAEGGVTDAHALTTLPTLPQLRMTRRLVGASQPGQSIANTLQSDSVGLVADWRKPGTVYELPLGSLQGVTNRNLWAAGRCISVQDDLWDVTRVIPAAAVTGEAAGIAAAAGEAAVQPTLRGRGVPLHFCEIEQEPL